MNGGRLINGDEYLTYTQVVERMRGILVERLATLDEKNQCFINKPLHNETHSNHSNSGHPWPFPCNP